jgi:hypothetical protein
VIIAAPRVPTARFNSRTDDLKETTTMTRAIAFGVAAGVLFLLPATKAQEPSQLPEHKILAMEEGVWDADITTTLPGQEPMKSKGVETNRLLAGKWLISDFKGEFFGQPFEGHGVNGYDAKKGKYVATWVDTMSAHIDSLDGSYDDKTKTLTLNANSEDPSGKPMKMRLETQFKDDNTRIFTEYVQSDGQKEFVKFMEVKYTKRKK